MKRKNTTRNALFTSIIALLMCVSMLVGTTFAWFTDEVVTGMNTIAAGNLDVELLADGNKVDSNTKLFELADPNLWEPGVVAYENLQVANVGTLALKYQMSLNFGNENDLNGHKLSEVLKVVVLDEAIDSNMTRVQVLEKAKAAAEEKIEGTQTVGYGALSNFYITGELEAKTVSEEFAVVIYWAPNDNATDNLYNANNGQVTSDGEPLHIEFGVNLQATQKMSEKDSFGNDYDEFASILPKATVNNLGATKISATTSFPNGTDAKEYDLDVAFQFLPNETYDEAQSNSYRYWHADYVIKADKDVPAKSMALAGYYAAFCKDYNGDNWVLLSSDEVIPANTEIRLVKLLGGGSISVNYEEICNYGNDGVGFLCGAVDLTGANIGTTITVELRLYETTIDPSSNSGSANIETGNYEVVGKYSYTFGGSYVTLPDGTVLLNEYEGNTVLSSVANVEATDYTVPEGVDVLPGGVFAANSGITSVTVPASATDFGATGVSATGASGGAFKGSAVQSVILEEGMTEIPAAAFNGAKNLTSVSIPSSVTTVGVNAFRQTALTELTIPETVKTVKTGAFRDMSVLTTVTVEGNVNFENYAFRSVPNLTSIYLLGDDVTINGGQFATHSDDGDATGITIYVKNATVAARVYAAQTSAYGYEVKILGDAADGSDASEVTQVKNDAALAEAIADGASTVVLGSGNYTMPDVSAGSNLTIVGNGDTVVASQDDGASEGDGDYSLRGSTVTFENVTITTSTTYFPGYVGVKATYNNCTINGVWTLYDDATFNNCTFNVSGDVYNVWTWGAAEATFNGCTFNNDGKAVLLYGTANTKLTLNDCVFNDNGGLADLKAAIEIGNDYGKSYELIVNNATVNGYEINDKGINTGTTLWANKNSMGTDKLNVVVDGVDVY